MTIFGVILFASILLTGCGNNDNPSFEKNISELKYSKKLGKYFIDEDMTVLFTGTAGEKNSSNKTIQFMEINNGFIAHVLNWDLVGENRTLNADVKYDDGEKHSGWWKEYYKGNAKSDNDEMLLSSKQWEEGNLVFQKVWNEFGDKLILTTDLNYKNGNISNGFKTTVKIVEPRSGEGEGKLVITTSYQEYNKGIELKDKEWYVFSESSGKPYYDNKNFLNIGDGTTLGKYFCRNDRAPGLIKYYFSNILKIEGKAYFESFFECLKSKKLKGFYVHIE